MQSAETYLQTISQQHRRHFEDQLRQLGLASRSDEQEPYLDALLAQEQLQYVMRLERLFDKLEQEYSAASGLLSSKKANGVQIGDGSDPGGAPVLDIPDNPNSLELTVNPLPDAREGVDHEDSRSGRRALARLNQARQLSAGITHYRWQTAGDERVRDSHARNGGGIFSWDLGSSIGHPGEENNCRCSAIPSAYSIQDPPIEPVYPELGLVAALAARRAAAEIIQRIAARVQIWMGRISQTNHSTSRGRRAPRNGRVDGKWKYGKHKSRAKWRRQMKSRGWSERQIAEAIRYGRAYQAKNNISGGKATRYVHPKTGRSVVRDNRTKEILQVGGDGFRY